MSLARGELARALLARAEEQADLAALLLPDGREVSYGALAAAARGCAGQLRARGVQPGQRVALVLGDHPGFVAWYAGAQIAGAVPCPISPHQTPHELSRAMAAVRPGCVLAEEAATAADGATLCLLKAAPWDGSEAGPAPLEGEGRPSPPDEAPPGWEEIAAVHVTLRGVGRPLGVMHRASAQLAAAKSFCGGTGLGQGDLVLGMLPFAHIFSFTANLLAPLHTGACLLMTHGVAADKLPGLIEHHRPGLGFLTPPQAARLAGLPAAAAADLGSLERLWCGGAPFGADLVEQFEAGTGLHLLQGYGLTEAFVTCANPYSGRAERPETLGLPFPGFQMRVVGPDGQTLPDGQEGELQVAGEAVTAGILDDPELTAELVQDGWLGTGDLAVREADGHFAFRGWRKEIIKTLGLVVDLAELEAELRAVIPRAGEVTLTPRPRDRWGHVVAARVEVDGPRPETAEIRARLGERLSFYKLPQPLELVPPTDQGR